MIVKYKKERAAWVDPYYRKLSSNEKYANLHTELAEDFRKRGYDFPDSRAKPIVARLMELDNIKADSHDSDEKKSFSTSNTESPEFINFLINLGNQCIAEAEENVAANYHGPEQEEAFAKIAKFQEYILHSRQVRV